MKIDSALREFSERYDRTAIQSIEDISRDLGMTASKTKFKVFNINEGFENFISFMSGYAKYKVENKENEKATSQDKIMEQTTGYITKLFKEEQIEYPELPNFVKGYIEGIKSLTETVERIKAEMMEAEVDQDSIGAVNEAADTFITTLNESFDPVMQRILWASGYNSRMRLKKPDAPPKKKPVFL